MRKAFGRAFSGTSLATFLRKRGIDTILLGGGCVRATAIDGHSHGFGIFWIEECCFDRSELSHLVNLFEINTRYGMVVRLGHALRWILDRKT